MCPPMILCVKKPYVLKKTYVTYAPPYDPMC
jgi:hypothetical protein